MYLLSVNVGKAQPIANAKKSGKTGIYKVPQTTPVTLERRMSENITALEMFRQFYRKKA